jgi:hypothetical protein
MLLFSANPTAASIKPMVYYPLTMIYVIAIGWTIGLASYGGSMVHRLAIWKSAIVSTVSAAVVLAAAYLIFARWML